MVQKLSKLWLTNKPKSHKLLSRNLKNQSNKLNPLHNSPQKPLSELIVLQVLNKLPLLISQLLEPIKSQRKFMRLSLKKSLNLKDLRLFQLPRNSTMILLNKKLLSDLKMYTLNLSLLSTKRLTLSKY